MLQANLVEYKVIRQSIESDRQRLTTLMSFAIGGSGVAYLAINTLQNSY